MKTHVTFVLDSSGSMSAIEEDTIGGFNSFLEEQRDEQGTTTVTLYDFNTNVECVYQARLVEEAPKLDSGNYTPSGRTALHDAISTVLTEMSDRISSLYPDARPDNVIVVVLTDGKENASETPQSMVRRQVESRREELDWEFLFIGANQDAALTASSMGIDTDRSLDMAHSSEGTRAAYESTSERIRQAREEGTTGGFEQTDRQKQDQARDYEQ
ncbi:vWA domain-containing protein [Natranaeroarchaeum sulfidigenes]|uniref:von Willebrand factor type A (VWA) domain n=1 Tax=Natranaeroarchaeum sulfidigenes TaxID=2784880 RepID=A0A897MKZ3_9EURY|nr:vWA domain-containing protein [Natranaeroarchaeum sulfidigenes]QSG02820.1 Von Willebrand factor type A (vWA) domain [Natranaeroarchaeum sulfidigenes]